MKQSDMLSLLCSKYALTDEHDIQYIKKKEKQYQTMFINKQAEAIAESSAKNKAWPKMIAFASLNSLYSFS